MYMDARLVSQGAPQTKWWRARRYSIQDGAIQPKGAVAWYDPWALYEDLWAKGKRWSIASELVELVRKLEGTHSEDELERGVLSSEGEGRVLGWCERFGLLGILPHRALTIVEPLLVVASQSRPRENVVGVRIGWRVGGTWLNDVVRYPEYRTGVGRNRPRRGALVHNPGTCPKPHVIWQDLFEGFAKAADLHAALRPFFPSLDEADRDKGQYPLPFEQRFVRFYSEPVAAFCTAARQLARLVDESRDVEERKRNRRALVAGVNPDELIEEAGAHRWQWASPSLLGTLATMVILDNVASCPMGVCAWEKCGRVFARRQARQKFCCETHRNTATVSKYRGGVRRKKPSSPSSRKRTKR